MNIQSSHSRWVCGANTKPYSCPDCGHKVFLFTCECGCWVLFDELGHPWLEHDCPQSEANQERSWNRNLVRERHPDRLVVRLNNNVSVIRLMEAEDCPNPVGTSKSKADEGQTLRMVPRQGDSFQGPAIVREVQPKRPLKHDLVDARNFMRIIHRHGTPMTQITVETQLDSGDVGSFTGVVEDAVAQGVKLVRGLRAWVGIHVMRSDSNRECWVFSQISRLGGRKPGEGRAFTGE